MMLRAASPVGHPSPLSRGRSQATVEINASEVDSTAAEQRLFSSRSLPDTPWTRRQPYSHPAPIHKSGLSLTHTAFHSHKHTHSLTHSLTHSPPFRQHTLTHTGSFSQTPASSHTPLRSCPGLRTHSPPLPAHGPPSLMHKPSLTPGSWVSTQVRLVLHLVMNAWAEDLFHLAIAASQSLVGEMRSPSFIKLLVFFSH